jgi:Cu/Ag efflux pump CusA
MIRGRSQAAVFLMVGLCLFLSGEGATVGAAPAAVDVLAQYPGASAEEVERQVTIPLEVALSGLPGLEYLRSQSRFGLSLLRAQFKKNTDVHKAKQEVSQRLQQIQALPAGVTPQLTLVPGGILVRYTLHNPRDARGRGVYTLSDLTTLRDHVLGRTFLRIPRVAGVSGFGGKVKRYEIHPDPDRLARYGITLQQLEDTIVQGVAEAAGRDALDKALAMKAPGAAAAFLRAEEDHRLRAIRRLLIATVKRMPVRLEDVGEVAIGYHDPHSRVGIYPRKDETGRVIWEDEEDRVEGAVLLRSGEDRTIALRQVNVTIKELNASVGRLLPGVRIEPYDQAPGAGRVWFQANFLPRLSLNDVARVMRKVRRILGEHAEVEAVVSRVGGSDDGLDATGVGQGHCCVVLKPRKEWPAAPGRKQPRSPLELEEALRQELEAQVAGVEWSVPPAPRDAFAEVFTPAPGEGVLKILGPDLDRLEGLALGAKRVLEKLPGASRVRLNSFAGPPALELSLDRQRCARWGISISEVGRTIALALDGKALARMVEGEKRVDVVLRWPARLRSSAETIMDIPVESAGPRELGKLTGSPRVRLRDLAKAFLRSGVAVIYREEGQRLIALRCSLRDRDEATVRAEAKKKLDALFKAPYRAEWAGR